MLVIMQQIYDTYRQSYATELEVLDLNQRATHISMHNGIQFEFKLDKAYNVFYAQNIYPMTIHTYTSDHIYPFNAFLTKIGHLIDYDIFLID